MEEEEKEERKNNKGGRKEEFKKRTRGQKRKNEGLVSFSLSLSCIS
jgi:hypothetical protein